MKKLTLRATALLSCAWIVACGDSGPTTTPLPPTITPPPPTAPATQITTLVTVYKSANALAEFSQATMSDESLAQTLLGVDTLTNGTILLDNESLRFELQAAIERVMDSFADADFETVFGETKVNLRRYFNDADNDGWSVDGRHGLGRDWPHDRDGNDPDGWTSQIVVTVERP